MWWDRLSLHVPIWIAFATFGYQFGGGGAPVVEEEVVEVVEVCLLYTSPSPRDS